MESIFAGGIAIWILGIALLISPLMIWYHVGHVSRKLNRVIELLEQNQNASQKGVSTKTLTPSEVYKSPPVSNKTAAIIFVILLIIIVVVYIYCKYLFHG